MKLISSLVLFIAAQLTFLQSEGFSQRLKPGFDPVEYRQLLEISTRQLDTPWTYVSLPFPENCRWVYRSDTVGLNNRWDLWIRDDSVGIISIRGTIKAADSWAEDMYCAMVPATGSMIIDNDFVFSYKLAEDRRAAVHAGWLLGLAYLSESIITQMNRWQAQGVKEYLIIGHSQGGAISYLLASYLHYIDKERVPDGLKYKTYCSAPPKPGNLFYSYDYDYIMRDGWGMRVYNSADWVPETPVSVQTLNDFSTINPYSQKDSIAAKMGFFEKIVFDYLVDRIDGTLNDSRDLLLDYFGKMVYENSITKYLPHFPKPQYTKDTYFYPCGVPVVLMKQGYDAGYDEILLKETSTGMVPYLFENHMIAPYYYLLNKIYFSK